MSKAGGYVCAFLKVERPKYRFKTEDQSLVKNNFGFGENNNSSKNIFISPHLSDLRG